jgi:hypothetical protein
MLSNLPSRINYRTSSEIRQDLKNWMQPAQPSCDLKTCNQSAKTTTEPVGREALATNQRTINCTGRALQPLSEASTGCGNGLQLISDASTAIA